MGRAQKKGGMLKDWQQVDFGYLTHTFSFNASEFDMDTEDENLRCHFAPLIPAEIPQQMALLLEQRATINHWSDWLCNSVRNNTLPNPPSIPSPPLLIKGETPR
jgi:hypothetical protein